MNTMKDYMIRYYDPDLDETLQVLVSASNAQRAVNKIRKDNPECMIFDVLSRCYNWK